MSGRGMWDEPNESIGQSQIFSRLHPEPAGVVATKPLESMTTPGAQLEFTLVTTRDPDTGSALSGLRVDALAMLEDEDELVDLGPSYVDESELPKLRQRLGDLWRAWQTTKRKRRGDATTFETVTASGFGVVLDILPEQLQDGTPTAPLESLCLRLKVGSLHRRFAILSPRKLPDLMMMIDRAMSELPLRLPPTTSDTDSQGKSVEALLADYKALIEKLSSPISQAWITREDVFNDTAGMLFLLADADGVVSLQEANALRALFEGLAGVGGATLPSFYAGVVPDSARLMRTDPRFKLRCLSPLVDGDRQNGSKFADLFRAHMLRLLNTFVKLDHVVTPDEQRELLRLESILWSADPDTTLGSNPTFRTKMAANEDDLEVILAELAALVGLTPIKRQITELISFVEARRKRMALGLRAEDMSLHSVFTGNPGTGKTTIARMLGRIYRNLGLLSTGHVVEVDRGGLVAGYVGQTAAKVTAAVEKSIGGILFIDEAYALHRTQSEQDYGSEAIETLLKLMEDRRSEFVVIAAGYPKPMQAFLASNPGLKSRFNIALSFPDYSAVEMLHIFEGMCERADYVLEADARMLLEKEFHVACSRRGEAFGNGRFVRNVFEEATRRQATRIVMLPDLDRDAAATIISSDLPALHDRL